MQKLLILCFDNNGKILKLFVDNIMLSNYGLYFILTTTGTHIGPRLKSNLCLIKIMRFYYIFQTEA